MNTTTNTITATAPTTAGKTAKLYIEECMGREQGGSTLHILDSETGDLLSESTSSTRRLRATFFSLLARGMSGQQFTCHGRGGWITNVRRA